MRARPATSVIRFGMGAVKNVGQGPVDLIMAARQDGPFRDLTDFAQRVDLRQVGRRALESLIKVGALDRFGSRPALLEAFGPDHFGQHQPFPRPAERPALLVRCVEWRER